MRRGYFIAGAGAAQFALPGAVDKLRDPPTEEHWVLAACDPANPYGTVVPWPSTTGHRPARRAGAMVVLRGGHLVCYLERGAHTLVTFDGVSDDDLMVGLGAIGTLVDDGRLDPVALTRVDQQAILTDPHHSALLQTAGFRPTPQGMIRRPVA